MNSPSDFENLATRRAYLSAIAMIFIATVASPARADREADFKKLEAEYKSALQKFEDERTPGKMTAAEHVAFYDRWPGWQYLPKFVARADANPTDETAYQSCQWIIDRSHNCGTADGHIFSADQKAWQILAMHHSKGENVPKLCCEAARYLGPAREAFLRGLIKQKNISKEDAGFATLALANSLASRCNYFDFLERDRRRPSSEEFRKFAVAQQAPEFVKYIKDTDTAALKEESMTLLHDVLLKYYDVPMTVPGSQFRRSPSLGVQAEQCMHALRHLSVGAEAPDIIGKNLDGKPLKLSDYRGRVVVLSFWFTGCGPCMQLIPEERKLVEKFKDRPFTLLGICGDTDLETARKTAKDEKIDWPCWFDGGTSGPINSQFDVTGWPTLYLIDANGRVAIKNMDSTYLADDVAEVLEKTK